MTSQSEPFCTVKVIKTLSFLENGDSVNMPSKIVPSPSKSVLYGSLAEDVLIV